MANLPSGFNKSDIITVYSIYAGYSQSFSFAVPNTGESVVVRDNSDVVVGTAGSAGLTGTLVLVVVPSSPSLKYFAVQDFLDYFELKDYSTDNENGIKTQRIILAGSMVEQEIEHDTKTKFDSNNGVYYPITDEYYDVRFDKQNDYFLLYPPIYSLEKFEIDTVADGWPPVWEDLQFKQVDECNSTTGWVASADGSVSLDTTNGNPSFGDECIDLIKSGVASATVTFSKSLSSFDFTNRDFYVDFYIEDATKLVTTGTAVEVRVGNDASDYYSRKFGIGEFPSAVWKTLCIRKTDLDNVTTTGTPTPSALTYFSILITLDTAATTIASPDMRLDDLRLNTRDRINLDAITGRIRITDSDNYSNRGTRHVRASYHYGYDTTPPEIKHLAILMTGMNMLGTAFMKARITGKGTANEPSLLWFNDYKEKIINEHKNVRFFQT